MLRSSLVMLSSLAAQISSMLLISSTRSCRYAIFNIYGEKTDNMQTNKNNRRAEVICEGKSDRERGGSVKARL